MRLAISTTETLTDLTTDLVVANNNNSVSNLVAPYLYLRPTVYLFMADIANSDLFGVLLSDLNLS